MRTAGYALLGFLLGAGSGFILSLLLMVLWFDVLGIGDHGGDGLSGLATYLVVMPVVTLGLGVAGAIWLGRKAGSQGPSPAVIASVLLVLLTLLAIFLFGGVFW